MDTNDAPPPLSSAVPSKRRIPLSIAPGPHGVRWKGGLREFVLIVSGVLVALAGQAWWEGDQKKDQERAYLEALRNELVHSRAAIQENKERLEEEIESSRTTAAILSSRSSTSLSADSIQHVTRVFPIRVFIPPRAALDDVLRSGGLTLIRSDSLRRALASYEQTLAWDLREQEKLADIFLTHLAPYRYQYGTLQATADSFRVGDLGLEINRTAFARNRTYLNLMLARMIRIRDVTTAHDSLVAHIDRILPMLKEF